MKKTARVIITLLLLAGSAASAQVSKYCCDATAEQQFQAAVASLGSTVSESFETAPWNTVRAPFSLASVTSQGVTWSRAGGGISTSDGNAHQGLYQVYAVGPDGFTHPVPDGFTVAGDGISFRAFGGWFLGQGTKLGFTVDGDANRVNFTGAEATVTEWKFIGFIDTTPFTSVSVDAVDEVGNEQRLFWADDFTFSTSGGAPSPGQLQFGNSAYSILENGTQVQLTVTRGAGSDGAVTVDYATSDGSATAGSDYTVTSGTLSFAAGETSKNITVPILDDATYEGDETFTVNLSNATGGATLGTPTSATVTIQEDDAPPSAGSLQLATAAAALAENGGSFSVTVTRNGGSFGAVTIDYTTVDGTASAGSDYTAASGTLSFADGVTSQSFNVPVADDAVYEGDETLQVTLSNPGGGATLGAPSSATLTITDNDPVPSAGTLAFSAGAYTVSESGPALAVTVSRSGGSFGTVTVDYSTTDGTAAAGSDYTASSGTLTFIDGDVTETFSVPITDDTNYEGDEAFTLNLASPTGGASLGAPSTASVTITENDPVPAAGSLQFTGASYSVAENGSAIVITVSRTGGSFGTVTIDYATTDGSATAGNDYTATSGILTFADGVTSQTFSVPIIDDSNYEGNESFTVSLSSATGGATIGALATASVTITENDPVPPAGSLKFSGATYSIAEDGVSLSITVVRTGGSFGTVGVNYRTSDATATAGSDYTATSGSLTFADGVTSQSFSVPILDDATYEGDESFGLQLSGVTGDATLGSPASATVTIVENDAVPPAGSLQFSGASYSVAENGGQALITVTRTGGSVGAVSVSYATGGGSATAGSDYTATSGTLTFADGVTSRTFNVPILDDADYEGNETVGLALSAPTNGAALGVQASATLTITENDAVPPAGSLQFSGATYAVAENGGSLLVTVTRNGGSFGQVSVDYSSMDGTATAGADYTAVGGTLTFADGVTSQTFNAPILDDATFEGDEDFSLSLGNAGGGAALGVPAAATVTIGDNDAPPPAGTLQFDSSAYSAVEGSSVQITITRSGGSTGDVSVDYQIEAGSATSGSDFEPTSGSIAFADGETSRSFDIPLPDDTLVEGNETFTARLTAAFGGADIGTPATATVTIIDNDSDTGTGGGSGGGGGGGGAISPIVMLLLACLAFFGPPQAFAGETSESDPHAHHKKMMSESTYRRTLHEYDLGDIGVTKADAVETMLDDLMSRDKPVMVHFIFTTCTTICPVQAATFAQVQRQLGDEAAEVQMVSVSIDPEYDTPERLAEYAKKFHAGPQWDFITGTSEQMIAVQKAFDAYEGNKMNHRPLTLIRMPGSDEWIRLEGLIGASVIVDEYRKFKNES